MDRPETPGRENSISKSEGKGMDKKTKESSKTAEPPVCVREN